MSHPLDVGELTVRVRDLEQDNASLRRQLAESNEARSALDRQLAELAESEANHRHLLTIARQAVFDLRRRRIREVVSELQPEPASGVGDC